jgi:hypothetical protein
VWRSKSCTVMSRLAGTVTSCDVPPAGSDESTATRMSRNSGMYFHTGSSRDNRPSSTSIIAATLTMGLVIEYMRKIASLLIATLRSQSRHPTLFWYTILPRRATATTAPGSSPLSTARCNASPIRSSRAADTPAPSGAPTGNPCAEATPSAPANNSPNHARLLVVMHSSEFFAGKARWYVTAWPRRKAPSRRPVAAGRSRYARRPAPRYGRSAVRASGRG